MNHERSLTLLVAALTLTIACGGSDGGPPVATPSVSINLSRAPLGAPLEMTYRFHVAPEAPIDGDYRVMVHFVDVDDELMWNDDHDPPTPTSQWKPGQTIEYTRTMFLPVYPYLGEATVQVGLYDAASGQRLVLAADDAGQRAYDVAAIELLPEKDAIFLVYGQGWNGPEMSSQNDLEEWRWTEAQAHVSFRNPNRDVTIYLQLDGRPDLFDGAQQVSLQIGSEVVDSFTLHTGERLLRRTEVPAARLGDGDVVDLVIATDRSFVPAELGETDTRRLGVRVFHLYVQ